MHFETGHLYHIYNQGNNRQPIFFNRNNYLFFLKKIRKHIIPFCDILAWCLIPNHFHVMVYVEKLEAEINSRSITQGFTRSETLSQKSLNDSIGIMLRTYTRAINEQEKRSGSLFRKETKAICLTKPDDSTRAWYLNSGIIILENPAPEKQYPNVCFNYILSNPVKDKLVEKAEDWEFSSCNDLTGIRNGNLINRERIKEFGLVFNPR